MGIEVGDGSRRQRLGHATMGSRSRETRADEEPMVTHQCKGTALRRRMESRNRRGGRISHIFGQAAWRGRTAAGPGGDSSTHCLCQSALHNA